MTIARDTVRCSSIRFFISLRNPTAFATTDHLFLQDVFRLTLDLCCKQVCGAESTKRYFCKINDKETKTHQLTN